jgi:hypothetical protein
MMNHILSVICTGALLSSASAHNIYMRGATVSAPTNQPTPTDSNLPPMATYVATIKNSEGRCVDLAWASERDYTPIESYPCVAGSPNQKVFCLVLLLHSLYTNLGIVVVPWNPKIE